MPRLIIANAFALGMIPGLRDFNPAVIGVIPVTAYAARRIVDRARQNGVQIVSAVGHQATADLYTRLLGHHVPYNRVAVQLVAGDLLLVGILGDRLPDGVVLDAAALAAYADRIQWVLVAYYPMGDQVLDYLDHFAGAAQ